MSRKEKEELLKRKIEKAVNLIREYGNDDGEHHKMWVIDQVLRILLTKNEYKNFRKNRTEIVDDEEFLNWDEGVPP